MKIDPQMYFALPMMSGLTAMVVFDGSNKAMVLATFASVVVLLVIDFIGHLPKRRKKP